MATWFNNFDGRIPKLASGSSIANGAHPKLVKTPSGGKATAIPGSAGKSVASRQTPTTNGQGRIVLRTRRQAELVSML